MIKYAAFLRAINVGGHGLIKMNDLRKSFESLGLKNVRTYIQSGNVLFESPEKNPDILREKIEKRLHKMLEYEVTTFLRTDEEMNDIVEHNPFSDAKLSKDLVLYVAFLPEEPGKNLKDSLISFNNKNEICKVRNREVYCLIGKKVKTLFSNNWLEKKLGMRATTRNWTTETKMLNFFTEKK